MIYDEVLALVLLLWNSTKTTKRHLLQTSVCRCSKFFRKRKKGKQNEAKDEQLVTSSTFLQKTNGLHFK